MQIPHPPLNVFTRRDTHHLPGAWERTTLKEKVMTAETVTRAAAEVTIALAKMTTAESLQVA